MPINIIFKEKFYEKENKNEVFVFLVLSLKKIETDKYYCFYSF